MLWGHRACAIRPLTLCLLGYVGLAFGVSQPLPELPNAVCEFNMVLRNFRSIISWKLRDPPIAPVRYTLWYANMSDQKPMEVVEHCTNITSLSCDVTHVWMDMSETYELLLIGSRGNATLVHCYGSIFPELDMQLEPPEFEVAGFTDHIRVTLEFPPALPQGPGLWRQFSLVIEEQLEGIEKKHKLKINEDTKGNFAYILDKLIPNTTYCVSVYFSPRDMYSVIKSPPKCARLQPAREPAGSPEPAGTGALIAVAVTAAVSVSALLMLRRVGYICLRSVPPKVLMTPAGRTPRVDLPCKKMRRSLVTPAGTGQGTQCGRARLTLPGRSFRLWDGPLRLLSCVRDCHRPRNQPLCPLSSASCQAASLPLGLARSAEPGPPHVPETPSRLVPSFAPALPCCFLSTVSYAAFHSEISYFPVFELARLT